MADISNQMADIRQRFQIQFSVSNTVTVLDENEQAPYITVTGVLPKPVLQFAVQKPNNWKGPSGPPGKSGAQGPPGQIMQSGSPGIPGYWGWGIPTR
jgi:hypothetical protein